MSGHGNFSAIDGVRPTLPTIQQPGEDIGVSLNKSVGGVNGPGASDAGGVKEEAPLKETSDAAEKTGALIRQLDVLLARAAESATKGIDAATLKDTLNQVNLAKGDRKAMNAAADKADAAFKAINKFTGFELAAAVSAKDGKFDWNMTNPAGEAIKKALDAQMELSDKLRQIANQLPRGELARRSSASSPPSSKTIPFRGIRRPSTASTRRLRSFCRGRRSRCTATTPRLRR